MTAEAREPFGIKESLMSLHSRLCPHCGGEKLAKKTFCRTCYFRLPANMQSELYKEIRNGYVEAVNAACVWLAAHPPQSKRGRHPVTETKEA